MKEKKHVTEGNGKLDSSLYKLHDQLIKHTNTRQAEQESKQK